MMNDIKSAACVMIVTKHKHSICNLWWKYTGTTFGINRDSSKTLHLSLIYYSLIITEKWRKNKLLKNCTCMSRYYCLKKNLHAVQFALCGLNIKTKTVASFISGNHVKLQCMWNEFQLMFAVWSFTERI